MAAHIEVAQQFGDLIAKEDYSAAHRLLTTEAQQAYSPARLKESAEGMRTYAPGPITHVEVMEDFVLKEWPAKQEGDAASVYVSLDGDGFCEAVSVVVAEEGTQFRIRHLEWGRP
jgi:peroxiredoxin